MGACTSSPCKCFVRSEDKLQDISHPHCEVVAVPADDNDSLFPRPSAAEIAAEEKKAVGDVDGSRVLPIALEQPKSENDVIDCDHLSPVATRGEEIETEYQSPRSSMSGGLRLSDKLSDELMSQPEFSENESVSQIADDVSQCGSESFPLSPLFQEEEAPRKKIRRRTSGDIIQKTRSTPSGALQIILEKKGQIESFYVLQESLGAGSFGAVMKAKLKASGASRAVKTISKDHAKLSLKYIMREISVMKKLDHPHVIKLYEIYETVEDIFLVMEMCSCGTLTDLVKKRGPSTEQQAAESMRQIVSAVYYLHKNNICHRDLKPDNVLVAANYNSERRASVHENARRPSVHGSAQIGPTQSIVLKVVDFGVSCVFQPGRLMTQRAGTYAFMAPEVMRKRYNHNCDMWSCGVIMYFILCGYLPFIGESDKDVVKCVIRGVVAFETIEWVDVKAHTMDFIGLLLKKNFRARYTAEQALHHDWFATYVEKISQAFLRHDLLSNLYSFRKLNKLKRSALTVLASMLRTEDVKESHNVFVSLDNNGDGSLSISELRKALAKQKGSKAPQGNLEGVFQDAAYSSLDDKLNPFTYTEFLAATFDRKQCITDKLLRAVFSTFDKNDDGSISLSELSEGHLLGHLSLEELAQTFEDLDLNGDCFLDFDEFSHMMRS